MNLITKITDKDLGFETKELNHPKIRMASRGIVINKDGKIAVMHKRLKNEYKLPGGGVENSEKMEEAFQREILEETGCHIKIAEFLGVIEEERTQKNFKQVSYVYVSKVVEDTNIFHLTKQEEDEQMELVWMELEEAVDAITNCYKYLKPSSYHDIYYTQFAVARDKKILEYYRKNKKPIRDAVRTFLILDEEVVCIEYKKENVGFLDIPGGKIEDGETPVDAAKREFLEETGVTVKNLDFVGIATIEYPDRIYKMRVFMTNEYEGKPKDNEENKAYFIPIDTLLKKEKRYAITDLLDQKYQNQMKNRQLKVNFSVDKNHHIVKVD